MLIDRRVFNVGNDLSAAGGTASELLVNVPSVAVDIDGNVSLRDPRRCKSSSTAGPPD